MKYFTHEWANGDDEESDPLGEYSRFLDTLDQTGSVYQFATKISLNDAFVDKVVSDSGTGEFRLLLITGDREVGYWRTELTYFGATLRNKAALDSALRSRPTEIWYDEFSRVGDALSHNFLLVPGDRNDPDPHEFSIEFREFTFHQTPVPDRTLVTPEDKSVWL